MNVADFWHVMRLLMATVHPIPPPPPKFLPPPLPTPPLLPVVWLACDGSVPESHDIYIYRLLADDCLPKPSAPT